MNWLFKLRMKEEENRQIDESIKIYALMIATFYLTVIYLAYCFVI